MAPEPEGLMDSGHEHGRDVGMPILDNHEGHQGYVDRTDGMGALPEANYRDALRQMARIPPQPAPDLLLPESDAVIFDGTVPPTEAFTLAQRLIAPLDALSSQQRLGVLSTLSETAPLVACALAVLLMCRDAEAPPALTTADWVRRAGRKTSGLALAQLLHHDPGLARHVATLLDAR
jgi:hypothetical protein